MRKLKIFCKTFFVCTLVAQGFLFAPKCIVVLNQSIESTIVPYAFFKADVANCSNLSEIIEKNFYFPPITHGRAPLLILSQASLPTKVLAEDAFVVGLVFSEKLFVIRRENGVLLMAIEPGLSILKSIEGLVFNNVIQNQKGFFAAFDQVLGVERSLPKIDPALLPDVIFYGALIATNGSPWAAIADWQKILPEMRAKMFSTILNGPIGRYKFPQFWRSGQNPACGCGGKIDHLIPVSINLDGTERITIGLPNICIQCEEVQNSQARNACTRAKMHLMTQAKRVALEREARARAFTSIGQAPLVPPVLERSSTVLIGPAAPGVFERTASRANLMPVMAGQFRRPGIPMPTVAQRRPRPAEGLAPELEAKRPR